MFNGIIEEMGVIGAVAPSAGGGARLSVETIYAGKLHKGASLAVDGVCLTVTARSGKSLRFDLAKETLDRTNLQHRKNGDHVNLELPITASTMISGHFVQGHIEGVARVKGWKKKGREDVRLALELPAAVLDYCVPKGSIALNGVSLTVASLRGRILEVALIPYTLQKTNLGDLKPGDAVNVETDVIGRYVVTALKKDYAKVLRKRGR
jgi:riboflavin synthase alpha subunit